MAEFPSTVPPKQDGYDLSVEWNTIITQMDSGLEQRRQKWTFPKYNIELTFDLLSSTDAATLWNFYIARNGRSEAFYFYDKESLAWTGLYIGVGDGSTQTFDLPGKTTTSQTIYVDGVSEAGVTILTGGGAESSDRVTFTVAPATGEILSCDLTGYLRIRCRFEEDKMTRRMFLDAIYRTGLKLKGLHG